MQKTGKQLLIIVLVVFSALFGQQQTAYAQKEGAINPIITGVVEGFEDISSAGFFLQERKNSPEKININIGTPVAQNTPAPLSTVITNTPDADGIIIHQVKYGETLFTIAEAYGVPIDQILTNSGLSLTTTDLREGQILVIQKATEPTATPSPTATIDPGTPTPTQVRPTRTPFPTRTPAPTRTPTRPPSLLHRALGNAKNMGIGLILISGLGLLLVLYLGFLKKS